MKFNPLLLTITMLVIALFNPFESLGQKKIKQKQKIIQALHEHDHRKCGIESATERLAKSNPQYAREVQEFKKNIIPVFAERSARSSAAPIIYVPVVVHVIHNGETVGNGANLSEERIQAQIDVLNEDFSAMNANFGNTPAQWQGDVGNPEVQFCLAIIDPDGNATNGITRHNIAVTGTNSNNSNIEDDIKPAVWWDSDEYYNIYTVGIPGTTAGGGVTGYAYYPTNGMIGSDLDGSVVDYRWFGGPGFGQSGYGTLTHETGHYLGLPHPFDGEDCAADDGVADTPNIDAPTSDYNPGLNCGASFPTGPISCGNEHMYVNFMDYVNDDDCTTSFTNGQINVMRAVLDGVTPPAPFNYGSRLPLANNSLTVCSFFENDAGIPAVTTPGTSICGDGAVTPVVTLQNYGSNNLTTVTISYQINSGTPVDFIWVDNLGTGETQSVTLAPFTPPGGTYTFTVYTTLPNGATDGQTSNDQSDVTVTTIIPTNLPLFENFEDAQWDPTANGVYTFDTDGDQFEWERNTSISAYGNGSASAVFNNYDSNGGSNPNNTTDALITSVYDFSTIEGAILSFDVAYAPYDGSFFDSLKVYASTDCGSTFTDLLFNDGNTGLATAPATTGLFTPSSTEWETHTIDLSAYDNVPNLTISFLNESGYGNRLFIDNINLSQGCSMTASPNGTDPDCFGNCTGIAAVSIADGGSPYTYLWGTNAGNATTAMVEDLCAGTYAVTVADAAGCTAETTVTLTDPVEIMLTMSSTNETALNADDGTASVSAFGGVGNYSYLWNNSETTATISNLAPGTYTVVVSDQAGCAVTGMVVIDPFNNFDNDAGITNIVSPQGEQCRSRLVPVVDLFNYGVIDLTSVTITYQIDNGTPVDLNWTGTLAPEATETIGLALYTPPAGSYTLKVYTSQPNGVVDEEQQNDSTSVQLTTLEKIIPPYKEDFETSTVYPTANQLTQTNVGNDPVEWEVTDAASGYGIGTKATVFDNDADIGGGARPDGTIDIITTPILDFSNTIGAMLSFDVAYTTDLEGNSDSLKVYASVDCGQTYNVLLFAESGEDLLNAAPTDGDFVPGATNWTTYILNLNGFTYDDNLTIQFHNISGSGNRMYIDNISVSEEPVCTMTLEPVSTSVSCNGLCDGTATVNIQNSPGPYTYQWDSNAGSVTTATAQNLCAGDYAVTVTDADDCTAETTVTILEPSAIVVSVSTTSVSTAGGNDGTATAMVSGGAGGYTYQWDDASNQTTATITGLEEGFYCVTVTDVNGCTAESCGTVGGVNCTNFSVGLSGTDLTCFNNNSGTLTSSVENGTAPYTYSWNTGAVTPNLTGVAAGSYTVTVEDALGCSSIAFFTLNEPDAMVVSVVCQEETSAGANDGSCTAMTTGGTPGYTELWSTGATGVVIENLSPGTYCITITDSQGCTEESCGTVDEVPCDFSVSVTTGNASCFGNQDGSGVPNIIGGTDPFTYAWSNGATTETVNNLVAGTYQLTVTDALSCEMTTSFTISEPSALTVMIGSTNPSTNAGTDGTATAIPSGGTEPYSYVWSNGGTTQVITDLNAGIYNVTVTDANACNVINEVELENPSVDCSGFAGQIDAQAASCNSDNGSASTIVSGGQMPMNYLWNNGATTPTILDLEAGSYLVTVIDANDCEIILGTEVIMTPMLTATLDGSDPSTVGGNDGSITANPTGGSEIYTYQWNTVPNQTTQTISALVAGTYIVTISDTDGCSITETMTLENPTVVDCSDFSVIIPTFTDVTCNGAQNGAAVALGQNGTAPYSYVWSNGPMNSVNTGLAPGIYTVTATDSEGCTAENEIELTEPPALSVTINATPVSSAMAMDGSAMAIPTGGTTPYVYEWSNGEITPTINNLSTGLYMVTVTDANGCIVVESTEIGIDGVDCTGFSITNLGITNVACFGEATGSSSVSTAGGTEPISFAWSNSAQGATISDLIAGLYVVTATDANGCEVIRDVFITQPAAPLNASFTTTSETSNGAEDGSIDVTVTGGTEAYTYSWTNGAMTQDLNGLAAGTYGLTVTDENGCTDLLMIVVAGNGADCSTFMLETDLNNVTCNGETDGIIVTTATGGIQPITYMWETGQSTQALTNIGAGTYTVTVVDDNDCQIIQSFEITEPSAIVLMASATDETMINTDDGTANVSVTGGTAPYEYLWSNGAMTPFVNNLAPNTYTVTVTDGAGCTETASVVVEEFTGFCDDFEALISSTPVDCAGNNNGTVSVNPSGGTQPYGYAWSNGGSSANLNNLSGNSYRVTITDANGCTLVLITEVEEPAALTVVVEGFGGTCGEGGTVTTTVIGGTEDYSYNWSNGSNEDFITNVDNGNYAVTITDANGCTTTGAASVENTTGGIDISSEVMGVSCFGDTNGAIDISIVEGTAPFTFNWSTNDLTEDLEGLEAGSYTVQISDAEGCSYLTSFVVPSPAELLVDISWTPAGNDNSGTALANISGGTTPYTYQWSNGANTTSIDGLSASTYIITVTDAQGCETIETVDIGVTSVDELPGLESFKVFPNPSNGNFVLDAVFNSFTEGNIEVYNIVGQKVYQNNFSAQDIKLAINISNQAAGSYLLLIQTDTGRAVRKFVITK